MLVQTFWPLMTYQSPSRTARVWRLAMSLPASGSEKPWHQSSSALRILPRCRALCAGVPWVMSVGPSMEMPPRVAGRRRVGARHLFVENDLLHDRDTAAAVLGGPVEADVARFMHRALPFAQPVHFLPVGARGGKALAFHIGGDVLREPGAGLGAGTLLLPREG